MILRASGVIQLFVGPKLFAQPVPDPPCNHFWPIRILSFTQGISTQRSAAELGFHRRWVADAQVFDRVRSTTLAVADGRTWLGGHCRLGTSLNLRNHQADYNGDLEVPYPSKKLAKQARRSLTSTASKPQAFRVKNPSFASLPQ
jgi:hypothetical protein